MSAPAVVDPALEKQRLVAFYNAVGAEGKIAEVDLTIDRYTKDGAEGVAKMWRLLAKKYNTTVPPYTAVAPSAAATPVNSAPSGVDAALERQRLIAFYTAVGAEGKIAEVDLTIDRYTKDGPEGIAKMWRLLAKKYNTTVPPYTPVPSSAPPSAATGSASHQAQSAGPSGAATPVHGAPPVAPTLTSGSAPTEVDAALETQRLVAFYTAVGAESKLTEVDLTIDRYTKDGPEGVAKMWRLLAKKYNTEVPPYSPQQPVAPTAPPAQAPTPELPAQSSATASRSVSAANGVPLPQQTPVEQQRTPSVAASRASAAPTPVMIAASQPAAETVHPTPQQQQGESVPPTVDVPLEKQRLAAFYTANKADDKLADVDVTVERYAQDGPDGIAKMWRLLAKKYGSDSPAYIMQPLQQQQQPQSSQGSGEPDDRRSTTPVTGHSPLDGDLAMAAISASNMNASLPPPLIGGGDKSDGEEGGADGEAVVEQHEYTTDPPEVPDADLEMNRLIDFYSEIGANDKINDIPYTVERYLADGAEGIAKMWRLLSKKYEADIPPYPRRLVVRKRENGPEGALTKRIDIPAEVMALQDYLLSLPADLPSDPHNTRAPHADHMVREAISSGGLEALDEMWLSLAMQYETQIPPPQLQNRRLLPSLQPDGAMYSTSSALMMLSNGSTSGGAGNAIHDEYRQKFEMFFRYYDPKKMSQIDSLMLIGESTHHSPASGLAAMGITSYDAKAAATGGSSLKSKSKPSSPKTKNSGGGSKSSPRLTYAGDTNGDDPSSSFAMGGGGDASMMMASNGSFAPPPSERKLQYERNWYEEIMARLEDRYGPMPTLTQYNTLTVFPEIKAVPEVPPILSMVPRRVPKPLDPYGTNKLSPNRKDRFTNPIAAFDDEIDNRDLYQQQRKGGAASRVVSGNHPSSPDTNNVEDDVTDEEIDEVDRKEFSPKAYGHRRQSSRRRSHNNNATEEDAAAEADPNSLSQSTVDYVSFAKRMFSGGEQPAKKQTSSRVSRAASASGSNRVAAGGGSATPNTYQLDSEWVRESARGFVHREAVEFGPLPYSAVLGFQSPEGGIRAVPPPSQGNGNMSVGNVPLDPRDANGPTIARVGLSDTPTHNTTQYYDRTVSGNVSKVPTAGSLMHRQVNTASRADVTTPIENVVQRMIDAGIAADVEAQYMYPSPAGGGTGGSAAAVPGDGILHGGVRRDPMTPPSGTRYVVASPSNRRPIGGDDTTAESGATNDGRGGVGLSPYPLPLSPTPSQRGGAMNNNNAAVATTPTATRRTSYVVGSGSNATTYQQQAQQQQLNAIPPALLDMMAANDHQHTQQHLNSTPMHNRQPSVGVGNQTPRSPSRASFRISHTTTNAVTVVGGAPHQQAGGGEEVSPFRGVRGSAGTPNLNSPPQRAPSTPSSALGSSNYARAPSGAALSVMPPTAPIALPAVSATEEVLNRANTHAKDMHDPINAMLRNTSQGPLSPRTPLVTEEVPVAYTRPEDLLSHQNAVPTVPSPANITNTASSRGGAANTQGPYPVIVPCIVKLTNAPTIPLLLAAIPEANRLAYVERLATDFAASMLIDPHQVEVADLCPDVLVSIKVLLTEEQARRNLVDGFVQKAIAGLAPLRHTNAYVRDTLVPFVMMGGSGSSSAVAAGLPKGEVYIETAACFGEFRLKLATQTYLQCPVDPTAVDYFYTSPNNHLNRRSARLIARTMDGSIDGIRLAAANSQQQRAALLGGGSNSSAEVALAHAIAIAPTAAAAGFLVSELSEHQGLEHLGTRNALQGKKGDRQQQMAVGASPITTTPTKAASEAALRLLPSPRPPLSPPSNDLAVPAAQSSASLYQQQQSAPSNKLDQQPTINAPYQQQPPDALNYSGITYTQTVETSPTEKPLGGAAATDGASSMHSSRIPSQRHNDAPPPMANRSSSPVEKSNASQSVASAYSFNDGSNSRIVGSAVAAGGGGEGGSVNNATQQQQAPLLRTTSRPGMGESLTLSPRGSFSARQASATNLGGSVGGAAAVEPTAQQPSTIGEAQQPQEHPASSTSRNMPTMPQRSNHGSVGDLSIRSTASTPFGGHSGGNGYNGAGTAGGGGVPAIVVDSSALSGNQQQPYNPQASASATMLPQQQGSSSRVATPSFGDVSAPSVPPRGVTVIPPPQQQQQRRESTGFDFRTPSRKEMMAEEATMAGTVNSGLLHQSGTLNISPAHSATMLNQSATITSKSYPHHLSSSTQQTPPTMTQTPPQEQLQAIVFGDSKQRYVDQTNSAINASAQNQQQQQAVHNSGVGAAFIHNVPPSPDNSAANQQKQQLQQQRAPSPAANAAYVKRTMTTPRADGSVGGVIIVSNSPPSAQNTNTTNKSVGLAAPYSNNLSPNTFVDPMIGNRIVPTPSRMGAGSVAGGPSNIPQRAPSQQYYSHAQQPTTNTIGGSEGMVLAPETYLKGLQKGPAETVYSPTGWGRIIEGRNASLEMVGGSGGLGSTSTPPDVNTLLYEHYAASGGGANTPIEAAGGTVHYTTVRGQAGAPPGPLSLGIGGQIQEAPHKFSAPYARQMEGLAAGGQFATHSMLGGGPTSATVYGAASPSAGAPISFASYRAGSHDGAAAANADLVGRGKGREATEFSQQALAKMGTDELLARLDAYKAEEQRKARLQQEYHQLLAQKQQHQRQNTPSYNNGVGGGVMSGDVGPSPHYHMNSPYYNTGNGGGGVSPQQQQQASPAARRQLDYPNTSSGGGGAALSPFAAGAFGNGFAAAVPQSSYAGITGAPVGGYGPTHSIGLGGR